MPQLIIKGLEQEQIRKLSRPLIDELQGIIGCPRDYFTIEAVNSVFIMEDELQSVTPLIQVNWFDRGQQVQDQAAAAIYRQIAGAGCGQAEIFFVALQESSYYENGKHY